MKLRLSKVGVPVTFLVPVALALLLDCGLGVAQEIPAAGELVEEEGGVLPAGTARRASVAPLLSVTYDARLYGPFVSEDSYSLRLLPHGEQRASRRSAYVLLGGLAGGLAGFAVERVAKPCDGERFLGCSLRPYSYAAAGATVGIVIGLATGRIVEGPPRD